VRTVARITVHTAARARVSGTAESVHYEASAGGRAGSRGWRTLRFRLTRARAGQRIVVSVQVARHVAAAATGTAPGAGVDADAGPAAGHAGTAALVAEAGRLPPAQQ
jgi:hypothetical protein